MKDQMPDGIRLPILEALEAKRIPGHEPDRYHPKVLRSVATETCGQLKFSLPLSDCGGGAADGIKIAGKFKNTN